MNIRTAEQLYDTLASDLVWRKKELTAYQSVLGRSLSTDRRDAFLRGAVALLYAHWEGYTKLAANSYLEYVAAQRLKNSELAVPLLAVAIRPLLRAASDSQRVRAHKDVVDYLLNHLDDRSAIPYREAITTRANLSSRVLREIIDTLGLDYTPFLTKETLLDEGLLERRNTIAHGEYLAITDDRYVELHSEVFSMMEEFTTQITNSAVLGSYRRAA